MASVQSKIFTQVWIWLKFTNQIKIVKKYSLKVTSLGNEFESNDMSHVGSLDSAKSYFQNELTAIPFWFTKLWSAFIFSWKSSISTASCCCVWGSRKKTQQNTCNFVNPRLRKEKQFSPKKTLHNLWCRVRKMLMIHYISSNMYI